MEIRNTILDFNKICRLCLTEETVMSSIYNEEELQSSLMPLPLRITACVSVEVSSTDGLPSLICATCLCQVDGWYRFKDLCENADAVLRKCIKNEPVQVEQISHVQNMAQEVKKYISSEVKGEGAESALCQTKNLGPKKKMKSVENTNGDGYRLYSLLKYGSRCSSPQDPDIKEEQEEILSDDEKPETGLAIHLGQEKIENGREAEEFDESLDNESLANRMRAPDSYEEEDDDDDQDFNDAYSSDDSMSLAKTKKILKEKSKRKTKRKPLTMVKESTGDKVRQARTIQTQTGIGTDEEFSSEVCEAVVDSSNDQITALDRKKIKSRKTQTPREKSPPKKRFRIRPAVPSSCTLCDKVYKNGEILRQHMKSHHVTGTIECPNCKLTFTSLRSLKYHEQRKHSNLEPVPCTFCGKKFLDKKYLRIHENIHSQANQYVCQFCGRKFIMKTNLTVHISRHHTLKTNDFICQVCGKAFPFKLYLKKHFKTHTDYKPHECNFCEAKFRENTLLRKHINSIHLKLRPFLCQYCHKTFTRSLYLREHMDSQHLGIQKKIECSRCGENFQNRNRLRQHECEGRLEVL